MNFLEVPMESLCDIAMQNHKMNDTDLSCMLWNHIQGNYPVDDKEMRLVTNKVLQYFIPTFRKNWKSSFYKKEKLKSRHGKWLLTKFTVALTTPKIGRRSNEDFSGSSTSTKRRKLQEIQECHSELEIQLAFLRNLRAAGKTKLANKITSLLNDTDGDDMEESIIMFTDDEAIALIEDAKLSKHQYEIIRLKAKAKNADIFVPYKNLIDAKKRCYPPDSALTITDQNVSIKLQELLDHTVKRLIEIPTIKSSIMEKNVKSLTLHLKYGCDGASDQSAYKQNLPDGMQSDESIFMVSMVPILLDSETEVIWENPHPGSTKFCIPISFQFAKETPELTKSEIGRIKEEIKELSTTRIVFGKFRCKVAHKMLLTMLDGKVAQNLTETPSAATCHLCKAKPTEMNDLNRVLKKDVFEKDYELGLSPLHAKIRFMALILNIAYRLPFCKWQASTNEQKTQVKITKSRIQQEFRKEMGLIIDKPKHGGGTSNDGNTARRFFQDPESTANITGVNVRLIERFSIILQVLSSGQKIDSEKFENYALETARMYVELFKWYYMPSSVHKILLHGANIIKSFSIPIGLLSEEAQEARNKDFKRFRSFNTRKCSRLATNTDLVHKLLISSDAYLSYLRGSWRHIESDFHPEALELLIVG